MSISEKTSEEANVGQFSCPRCNALLPPRATFCSSCGERLKRREYAALLDEQDIHTRYRITTLIRRYPTGNLYFALAHPQAQEEGQARMVAIRDIDVSGLSKDRREQAMALAQGEYDHLRRWHIPHTLVCTELLSFEGHLFLVSGLPLTSPTSSNTQRMYTLQDFLQSGLGLLKESRTLEWMRNLSQAVERLHRQGIILGTLDPYTVVLDKIHAQAEPRLLPFWILPELQKLLPQASDPPNAPVSYFKAPEALEGKAEIRSDVYSLGALFYLLLTGMPPDESTLRHRRRLRAPREINARISLHVDSCVMQALAIEPDERFASVSAFASALEDTNFVLSPRKPFTPKAQPQQPEVSDLETVRIIPLSQKDMQRWLTLREEKATQRDQLVPSSQPLPALDASPLEQELAVSGQPTQSVISSVLPATPPLETLVEQPHSPPLDLAPEKTAWSQHSTSRLPSIRPPAFPGKKRKKVTDALTTKQRDALRETSVDEQVAAQNKKQEARQAKSDGGNSLLKQIQRLLLGHQQRSVEAAAIIETPMRIRPDQPYNLRLHIMGRDEPAPHPDAKKGVAPAGLSALAHGEIVQVEVRSVLQQGYTYVLQQATVTLPATGYAAEVTIPMQQQPVSTTGRRDRLHIFFLNEQREPLYEKPFVLEIFISPLVQFGREGHQVLTIPL